MSSVVGPVVLAPPVLARRGCSAQIDAPLPQQKAVEMIDIGNPRFELGRVVATPAALSLLQAAGQSPAELLHRHAFGDWGDLPEEDRNGNEAALRDGARILSAYSTGSGQKLWVITEAADDHGRRAATTILLPSEY